jgi:hypothetical protein
MTAVKAKCRCGKVPYISSIARSWLIGGDIAGFAKVPRRA